MPSSIPEGRDNHRRIGPTTVYGAGTSFSPVRQNYIDGTPEKWDRVGDRLVEIGTP